MRGTEQFMRNVLQYLERTAGSEKGSHRIIDAREEIDYTQLVQEAKNTGAAVLSRLCEVGSGAAVCGAESSIIDEKLCLYEPERKPIPVIMDKGVNALIAFAGIVYSGCFYVLINPDLPKDRIEKILSVTNPEIILTDEKYCAWAAEVFDSDKLLLIEKLRVHKITDREKRLLDIVRQKSIDTDPLYANFTSGSTGVPKGVLVSHRSVIDFIDEYTEMFGITGEDTIGNQAPFDFDVSVKDIYSAFRTGAELVIIEKGLFSRPTELLDCLCDRKVTVMTWAVSALCLITTFHALDYKVPSTVKKVLFSGEVMPLKHLKEWMEHLPEAVFVNLYGPTEITCNCTYHVIERNRNYETGIPIGKAFPNERVFLLDKENRVIYPGTLAAENSRTVAGEICVAGTALALGYYNAPEETRKAFVSNPANTLFDERIYRTGDLAYYDENHDLVFAGRKDFQIKHMGHRIELEEIERAMMAVEGIERSCCVFDEKKSRLTGFYVGGYESRELHEILISKLPAFMVPGALKPLAEMPMTKNGKIDRKLLGVLAADRKAYKEYVGNQRGEG